MTRGIPVYSVTGQPLSIGEASDAELAAALADVEAERSTLHERENLIVRELARRLGSQTKLVTEAYEVNLRHRAYVKRREQ